MVASKPEFDSAQLIAILNNYKVKFVIIGGVAAEILGIPIAATVDLDITPARDTKNLRLLAKVFDRINAALATAEDGGTWFPRIPVENWAQYDVLHLITSFGLLDVVFKPAGAENGYSDLVRHSTQVKIGGFNVHVLNAEHLLKLKYITGRDKDVDHAASIERWLDGI